MSSPLEHDVLLVEAAGHYTVRRATGAGLHSRHHEGEAIPPALEAEAIATGDRLAADYGVDLWVVTGDTATLIRTHRSAASRS
jgi:hypothetical protein